MNNPVLSTPYDIEAEQAILGLVIIDNTLIADVSKIINCKTFYGESHQHIFKAITELVEEGKPVDEILIGDKLKELGKLEEIGGMAYLADIENCAPISGNIVYYAHVIKEHFVMRELITTMSDFSQKARDPEMSVQEVLSGLEQKIIKISNDTNEGKTVHFKDVLMDRVKEYEEREKQKKDIIGIPTGFFGIDDMISGLIAPNMISIAADSGMGKSAFAFNIVENVYKKKTEKRPTLIISREMSSSEIGDRMICSSATINSKRFKTGKLTQEESDRLYYKAGELTENNILINDHVHTFDQVVNESRYLHRHCEGGLCLIVIDYLQLLEGASRANREQEVSYMSRNTKRLAKELNIPIIALSQLNRDLRKRKDKHPIRSDLRESAAIEHDSDILMFIYREEFYEKDTDRKGIAEVIIDKHRNGPTGSVELIFQGQYTRFINKSDSTYKQWKDNG